MILRGISTPVQGEDAVNKEYCDGLNVLKVYNPTDRSSNRFDGKLLLVVDNTLQLSLVFLFSRITCESKPSVSENVRFELPKSDLMFAKETFNIANTYFLPSGIEDLDIISAVNVIGNNYHVNVTISNDTWNKAGVGRVYVTLT